MTVVRTVVVLLLVTASFSAADRPAEIPLWPGGAPGSEGKPAELHIYGTGGHGFGQRATNTRPVGQWMTRFEEWLAESGFLRRR